MCTWYLIPVGDAMMRTWLSGRCLDISGLILRLRVILTPTPTGLLRLSGSAGAVASAPSMHAVTTVDTVVLRTCQF